jgi:hypothetical protein
MPLSFGHRFVSATGRDFKGGPPGRNPGDHYGKDNVDARQTGMANRRAMLPKRAGTNLANERSLPPNESRTRRMTEMRGSSRIGH